ncbi:helix-turn-helix domain-containing protein [Vibrio rarus]|uniref:helix-turn-helix domain-containing protein n=1 Tax=Vibrio rarus TaxID=413403 RepID=UPI0021C265D3|nr:helix-turn-helix transcriptional regulator [Vibrio rarus]
MTNITNRKNNDVIKIKEMRLGKGLSQQDVERISTLQGIDLTRSKIAKIESGMIRVTDEMLKAFADVLQTPVGSFFGEEI